MTSYSVFHTHSLSMLGLHPRTPWGRYWRPNSRNRPGSLNLGPDHFSGPRTLGRESSLPRTARPWSLLRRSVVLGGLLRARGPLLRPGPLLQCGTLLCNSSGAVPWYRSTPRNYRARGRSRGRRGRLKSGRQVLDLQRRATSVHFSFSVCLFALLVLPARGGQVCLNLPLRIWKPLARRRRILLDLLTRT